MQVTNKRKNQRGMAVIMTALTMLVSIPLVGLAVDVGLLYMIRSKLYQAVDAASLAGARALADGATVGAQASSAQAAATKFFNANFPTAYWGTTNIDLATPTVDSTSTPNYRTVTTSATLQAPLYFLRILGQNTTTIAASSQAGRRDVAMMLVLDRSSSMNYVYMGTTACAIMITDATQFLTYFAPGRDMVGLVVFGSSVYTYPPTTTFTTPDGNGNTPASLIGGITCGGNTNTDEAMYQAYNQILNVDSTTRANVIVLMTDGRPNGFTGQYYCTSGCGSTGTIDLRNNPGTCDHPNTGPLIGEVEQWAGGPLATGETAGLSLQTATTVNGNDGAAVANSAGCAMASNIAWAPPTDFKKMPTTDIHGNSVVGNYSVNNPNAPYSSGSDTLSVSSPQEVEVASVNSVDNMSITIRTNTTLAPNIYTIALEGNAPADPPDTLLLRKMANDPTMQNDPSTTAQLFWTQQNPGQTVGYFVDAPDPSQLSAAFNSIAERITVRLAR
jgi:Flp pilus assembly protein TadG